MLLLFCYFILYLIQTVVFIVIWFTLLLGIFIIVQRFLLKRRAPVHVSNVAAFVLTSTYFFHILHLVHLKYLEYTEESACTWYRYLLSTCDSTFNYMWLWRLDPITVTANFLGELLIKFSSLFGRSIGAIIAGVFHEIPWLLQIPAAILCALILLFSIFALFGYELHVFGILRISKSKRSKIFLEKKAILPAPVDRSLCVVKELYQKAINK